MHDALSEQSRAYLTEAGWTPQRRVEVSTVEAAMQELGYPIYPVVHEFLTEFYGLRVPPYGNEPALTFDPLDGNCYAAERVKSHRLLKRYEATVSGPLVAIGWAWMEDYLSLWMDKGGTVYALSAVHETCHLLGTMPYMALDNLMTGRHRQRTLVPYNEFELEALLMRPLTIVSVGHINVPEDKRFDNFGALVFNVHQVEVFTQNSRYAHGYQVDRFLRAKGYTVYTVNSDPSAIDDVSEAPIYPTVETVPTPADVVVYQQSGFWPENEALDTARACGAKVIFPSFKNWHEYFTDKVYDLGIDHIESIAIQDAYTLLVEGQGLA